MRIFAFHLLNDFSGSPKVLSQVLKGLAQKKHEITLVTSLKNEGFLSDISDIAYVDNRYQFRENRLLRLWTLFFSQLRMITILFRQVKSNDVIYINTVLPFGAAILGKLKGCKIVYHLHETSMKPAILKRFLFFLVRKCATEVIYVSDYLSKQEPLELKSYVVYNSINPEFLNESKKFQKKENDRKQILMICSLKAYKGVFEFVQLAKSFSKYDFHLVVNASKAEIDAFFSTYSLPSNLQVYPKQSNVHPFYQNADLVLNMSRPDEWVETFGLTAIEAMAYGIPVIVPPVGGIAEIVEEEVDGFKVSCYDATNLNKHVVDLLENNETYERMRQNCFMKIERFSESEQIKRVEEILCR